MEDYLIQHHVLGKTCLGKVNFNFPERYTFSDQEAQRKGSGVYSETDKRKSEVNSGHIKPF